MVYVEGRGWRMGLALGAARAQDQQDKQYDEDLLRSISEHLEDRAFQLSEREKKLADQETLRQANEGEFDAMQKEGIAAAYGKLPPYAVADVPPEVNEMQGFFDRVKDVGSRFQNPENAQRWYAEKKVEAEAMARKRAAKTLAQTLQDKAADGGFNYTGEPEIDPDIESKLEVLMTALDSPDANPITVAEQASALSEVVRKENQRVLEMQRTSALLQADIDAASKSGSAELAQNLEMLQTLWEGRDITGAQLAAARFELLNPDAAAQMRESAVKEARDREEAKQRREVRKEAIDRWQAANSDKEGNPSTQIPSEEQLQPIIRSLLGPDPLRTVTSSPARTEPSGTDEDEAAPPPSWRAPTKAAAAPPAAAPAPAGPLGRTVGEIGLDTAPGAPAKAAPQTSQARPWAKLPVKERNAAESKLLAVAAKAGDLRAALAELKIEPESVPPALRKKLVAAAKKTGGPTMGETLGRMRPGAGGM